MQVRQLSERQLLQRLHRFCPPELIGDDAAVLPFPHGESLVITADTLVDGVHFSDRTTAPQDAGWRAVAANLSDLAAMGAHPLGITVSLTLPPDTQVAWIDALYEGMTEILQQFQTPLVGGDVCRSTVRSLAVTAFGRVRSPIYRHTARVGDAIFVSGLHGASRGGLELLLNPQCGETLTSDARHSLIRAHQRPRPRLDLLDGFQALNGPRIAGMDSSDGLADAVVQLARESGVGAKLWCDRLPIAPELLQMTSCATARNWTLYGGEDFELVLCLPPSDAERLSKQFPEAAIVGEIVPEAQGVTLDSDPPERLSQAGGFQHF